MVLHSAIVTCQLSHDRCARVFYEAGSSGSWMPTHLFGFQHAVTQSVSLFEHYPLTLISNRNRHGKLLVAESI
jgi:hypothetical protein